ncbi:MAG: alanyl-tRNA editing protein [Lachnospiraceae bacterium]|nr:alanyl-tRNA editing protein [Lachnospiraceae bacterium]
MKTIRLFDETPYETEFAATVLSVEKVGGTVLLVELDRTMFFPEEGGQSSDTGILRHENSTEEFIVSHVIEDNSVIYHEIDWQTKFAHQSATDAALQTPVQELLAEAAESSPGSEALPLMFHPGDRVSGRIDFAKRFSNMQNHTGEHILSGLLHKYWDSENVGFHLSEHIVTLDTSKQLKKDDIRELEEKANAAVYQNIPVTCRYYRPEELKDIEYRSKKELSDDIRLVTIPGIDVCACCAPHVKYTGEVGLIKVVRFINYKGGTRLTILAGKRAFAYISELQDIADELALKLTTGTDRLKESVEKLVKEGNDYKLKYKETLEELWELKLKTLDSQLLFIGDELDPNAQRKIVNRLNEKHTGINAVFVGSEQNGYRFILSYNCGDAREASELLKNRFSAKCGGSKEMIQGSIAAPEEEIRSALSQFRKNQ